MVKELWINLPVKDIKKAEAFFIAIGFRHNEGMGNSPVSSSIIAGSRNIVIMLFEENTFKHIISSASSDERIKAEVLFSFSAESREEVDTLAEKVSAAGGEIYSKPADNQGWMYGFAFRDLDAHHWNVLYMDMEKMPEM